ncbi:hypothetical protein RBH29_04180 [Herbivorax sp. ANBcel31]|uniref:InlB B-repeat-containing protein n=1 Tax=Herbivorax sp. ANBcel31 TaxID=3069754 RepID=UPI0027ADC2B3|nr:hypothetical protein [Herbivorax sp. ANBcel31]MDQ2085631.1 hypothetical protein [Herbivorax sp. ANBcel31]
MKKVMLFLMSFCVFILISVSVYGVEEEYDDLDRLTKVVYDNGTTIEYKYDLEGNIKNIITTYAEEKPESLLEVSIIGNGSVNLNTETVSLPVNYKYNYEYGTLLKLTAEANAGSEFAYWEDGTTGSIISKEPVYQTFMGTGENVKAVFYRTPEEDTNQFTVVLNNRSGRILQSTNVAKNENSEKNTLIQGLLKL